MKINVNQILSGGLVLEEIIKASGLDLETEIIKHDQPLRIRADIDLINNALTADISVDYVIRVLCSRCLNEFELKTKKDFRLNYAVDKSDSVIDLDPDIREEIILDYPFNPLCRPECKGICLKCGKNLNEGECNCQKK